jgi:predicted nuclease of predicted toxin-antitoxin system
MDENKTALTKSEIVSFEKLKQKWKEFDEAEKLAEFCDLSKDRIHLARIASQIEILRINNDFEEILEFWKTSHIQLMKIGIKDSDFIDLVCRLGTPPQILWLTCGNVTNRNLQKLLSLTLAQALTELKQGENIVEISQLNLA